MPKRPTKASPKRIDLAAKVNCMLKQGYAHKDEPYFEEKMPWPWSTKRNRVYVKMLNMVLGKFADPSPMLDGVDPARARWYLEMSASNRPGYLEEEAKRTSYFGARFPGRYDRGKSEHPTRSDV